MKFERDLDQDLIPEWRAKYLDYKLGKQKIRACEKAIEKANRTPGFFPTPSSWRSKRQSNRDLIISPAPHTLRPRNLENEEDPSSSSRKQYTKPDSELGAEWRGQGMNGIGTASGRLSPRNRLVLSPEMQPLKSGHNAEHSSGSYGSIGSTPPLGHSLKLKSLNETTPGSGKGTLQSPEARQNGSALWKVRSKSGSGGPPSLRLPEPALASHVIERDFAKDAIRSSLSMPGSEIRANNVPSGSTIIPPRRSFSTPHKPIRRPTFLNRLMSTYSFRASPKLGLPLEVYEELEACQEAFFHFLNAQLDKVETFYKEKEDESVKRLQVLEEQLAMMKSRHAGRHEEEREDLGPANGVASSPNGRHQIVAEQHEPEGWTKGIARRLRLRSVGIFDIRDEQEQDRHHKQNRKEGVAFRQGSQIITEMSYKDAKSRLKHALQEFYRGLQMLKSYAQINREAFRKINKKFEKAVALKQTGKFMSEKVDQAWFVQSNVVENYLSDVEYLYARYFAKGSHKVAVSKLKIKRPTDYSSSSFRDGLLLGAGAVLTARALSYAYDIFITGSQDAIVNTPYLLQIYGGYFLALLLFFLFCLDCCVWTYQKINYVFIFEFDTRHNLDWRQLAELPCLLWFIFGLIMFINFRTSPSNPMFLYWPVVLIGISTIILLMPIKVLYHRSRLWWINSNLRLYVAGVYPVEFRDFLIGDMYCSLTYTMGNIESFFCLYAKSWNNPSTCGSSHSRVLGFLACLPGIWRALQCLRRYRDTRMAFPHIANCAKYLCTVLFYMTLSLYRIEKGIDPNSTATTKFKAVFILFATINSIYVSLWDVLIDWSLGHSGVEWRLLREPLGFSWPPIYYIAMVVDPIFRFNWIFYLIGPNELQQSALLPFFVSLSEIFRRAFWALFRVENEHMTNVGMFRASRDLPLPYNVSGAKTSIDEDETDESSGAPLDEEQMGQIPKIVSTPKPMSTPRRVGTAITMAHAHDFERRKPEDSSSDESESPDDDEELEQQDGYATGTGSGRL